MNHNDRFDRVAVANTGLPYNPDVHDEVVREVEAFWANAPTPSLTQMQRALSQMAGNQATKFAYWQKFCWETENMPIGFMMSMTMEQRSNLSRAFKLMLHTAGIHSPMPTALARAYDAPFPDPSFKMGPRAMPSQVPTLPTSPSMEEQRKAWDFFSTFEKPFLCAFADNDPVTAGLEEQFKERVPGARGLPHTTIKSGGHFVQENAPEQVSKVIIDLIRST